MTNNLYNYLGIKKSGTLCRLQVRNILLKDSIAFCNVFFKQNCNQGSVIYTNYVQHTLFFTYNIKWLPLFNIWDHLPKFNVPMFISDKQGGKKSIQKLIFVLNFIKFTFYCCVLYWVEVKITTTTCWCHVEAAVKKCNGLSVSLLSIYPSLFNLSLSFSTLSHSLSWCL